MTDSLLASTDIEEALSRRLRSGRGGPIAGYTTADYDRIDRDGIDMAHSKLAEPMRPGH